MTSGNREASPHSGEDADYQRLAHLFYYLCACLAIQQKPGGEANASAIAERLGNKDDRKLVSLLLQDPRPLAEKQTALKKWGRATTGTVVAMLSHLNQQLRRDYQRDQAPYSRVLSPEDILTVLYKLVDLTPHERQALKLPATDSLTLLQRALLILQTTGGLENREVLLEVYKSAIGLNLAETDTPLNNLDEVDALVESVVRRVFAYLPERPQGQHPSREATLTNLIRKAQREVRRLLTRSGNQLSSVSNNRVSIDAYVRKYLRPKFVAQLAQTVVTNERLTDQFPVYLKDVSVMPSGPLPFADSELDSLRQTDSPYQSFLHPAFRWLDQGVSSTQLPEPRDYELASQQARAITVRFYIKVPESYQPIIPSVFAELTSNDHRRMDFSLHSTGIGGALSHVIKVINTALLNDIACLKDYFPIGHDIIATQKIVQDDVASPVWAHSLVKLCCTQTVAKTLLQGQETQLGAYEAHAFADPIGHGDYCGFDFLTSQAQSAFHARLQAIRNSGVVPTTYIKGLCQRTEQFVALEHAWKCLHGYPFSSLAMIGLIRERILNTGPTPTPLQRSLQRQDPYIYFDACLSIVEALLIEGLYRPAYGYLRKLQVLDEFVSQGLAVDRTGADTFEVFSGALIVRYLLCLANYYYLYDTEDRDPYYLPPRCPPNVNRENLVRRAWETLAQAKTHMRIRLRKYAAVNEVSQSIFHPHYRLLGRIALQQAKLLFFYPRLVPLDRSLPTDNSFARDRPVAAMHWGRLYLSEKARLYAAADGDSETYAVYAAMQAWMYLVAAYAAPNDCTLRPDNQSNRIHRLSVEECFRWAKQLRDHALISYDEVGRKNYYQIKEKSGLPPEDLDPFGSYHIQKLPAIYECRSASAQLSQTVPDILSLDISLLAIDPATLPKVSPHHPNQRIYLFGSTACYLFFVRGLYVLCSNETEEFWLHPPTTEIDWPAKLRHAIRLFDMAWGIAEEGCSLEKRQQNGKNYFHITRSLWHPPEDEYASPEVNSIRNLYPCRITEIADLGQIFSAATMELYATLAPAEERTALHQTVNRILSKLHHTQLLRQSRTLKALIRRQHRYNGHLSHHFRRVQQSILQYRQQCDRTADMRSCRDRLVTNLFTDLHLH